jgi:hypothetical protein
MRPGTVTFARTIRPGDEILDRDAFVRVATIRRAQGRKPKVGENLHLVTDAGAVIKLNSGDPIRVRRA